VLRPARQARIFGSLAENPRSGFQLEGLPEIDRTVKEAVLRLDTLRGDAGSDAADSMEATAQGSQIRKLFQAVRLSSGLWSWHGTKAVAEKHDIFIRPSIGQMPMCPRWLVNALLTSMFSFNLSRDSGRLTFEFYFAITPRAKLSQPLWRATIYAAVAAARSLRLAETRKRPEPKKMTPTENTATENTPNASVKAPLSTVLNA
jgi:hypothetical protein